jgi:hypothetical protein
MLAAQSIKAGDNSLVIAGGFENMTAAPHFANVREGVKFGNGRWRTTWHDGLTCAFECWAMGNAADHIAKKYGSPAPTRTASRCRATSAPPRRPRGLVQERDRRAHRRAVHGQEEPPAPGVSA